MECARLERFVQLDPMYQYPVLPDTSVLKMLLVLRKDFVRPDFSATAARSMNGQSTNHTAISVPLVIIASLEAKHRMHVDLVNLHGGMVMIIAMHVSHVSIRFFIFIILLMSKH